MLGRMKAACTDVEITLSAITHTRQLVSSSASCVIASLRVYMQQFLVLRYADCSMRKLDPIATIHVIHRGRCIMAVNVDSISYSENVMRLLQCVMRSVLLGLAVDVASICYSTVYSLE